MGFEDWFRLSAHAVITDDDGRVLLLEATYADRAWGLPGGALDHDETVQDALRRECREELGVDIEILYLSGIYYHARPRSHAFIFRCALPSDATIHLSEEHGAWRYVPVPELPPVQRQRVEECLSYDGQVRSACF